MKINLKHWLYASLLIGLTAQVYYFFMLPDVVANHFGNNGLANGWMSNWANLMVSSLTFTINSMVFLSAPYIFKKTPIKFISFPKKEYWLAPERKDKSIISISIWIYFFGLATNVFFIVIFHLVFLANDKKPPGIDENIFFILLITYFVITGTWLIALFRKFNKTN